MLHSEIKIALAHDHLFQIGGAELVLKELTRLFPKAPIYTLICSKKSKKFLGNSTIITSDLQHMVGGIRFFKWYLARMPSLWEQFDFTDYDIVISSCSAFVKGLKTNGSVIHICYCHTPTRYLWSEKEEYISTLSIPEFAKKYLSRLLDSLKKWDYHAAQRVGYFIANSSFIADRIQKYYNRESVVIYPPIDTKQFTPSQDSENFYLVVSRLRPYKKVDLAIEAFNNLRLPLVIIGGGEELKRLKKMAKSNIRFLGEVDDHTRNAYLSKCKAFIHPQIEDFGISAVEAMASGKPVVAYKAGGALETVVQGQTGILFEEQTWESLAYAVLQLNKYNFNPYYIHEHAVKFDVEKFDNGILSLCDKLMNTHETDH